MDIVDPAIEAYLLRVTPERDPVVRDMERLGAERRFPIVGPLVGRLLHLQALALRARRVFECGSGFGYSAWWFATALPEGGEVTLTDGSAENCGQAREFLGHAGLAERAVVRQGDALAILEQSAGPFDIIFCDIDKWQYPRVHPFLKSRLRVGGLFICDNMLWSGRVAGRESDRDTQGVRELTRLLYADPALHTTIVPLRDGVSLSLRTA